MGGWYDYAFVKPYPAAVRYGCVTYRLLVRYELPWWKLIVRKQVEPPIEVTLALSAYGTSHLHTVLYHEGFSAEHGSPEWRFIQRLIKDGWVVESRYRRGRH